MIKSKQILLLFLSALLLSLCVSYKNIPAKNQTGSMIFGGLKRTWLIHIPSSYDSGKTVPLLIVLHGGGGTGRNMVNLTLHGFDNLSDENGFVVIYPDGIEKHWNDGRRGEETGYRAQKENVDDVGFISALIDHLVNILNIDPKRIYITGMSNGAMMTYRLGCELSGKIAAIAPVAGNIPQNILRNCHPSKPVSVLAINGTNDPLVPFLGGEVTGPSGMKKLGKVLSAEESVKFWTNTNNCSPAPLVSTEPDIDPHDGTRIQKEDYKNGKNNSEVILYIIKGGGHTWPGGSQYLGKNIIGPTSHDMNATAVIWHFFEKHTLK
jgi:polyhydroxybutyrate depolymerase